MYKQLTSGQRYTISILLQKKTPKSEIAELIGVDRSTVYREIKPKSGKQGK